MVKRFWVVLLLTVPILFYFAFLGDYLSYRSVVNNKSNKSINNYYSDHPNGYFTEEVNFIEIQSTRDIELVRSFLTKYPPDSKNYSTVKLMRYELWDEEIKKYDSNKKSSNSKFFKNVLAYMKENDLSKILVKINKNLDLKDLKDFDKYTISKLDSVLYNNQLKNNTISLKENFSEGDTNELENILIEGISKSFENVFSKNFVQIEKYSDSTNTVPPLIIDISYKIKNQVFNYERFTYPVVWTLTNKDKPKKDFLLGTSIDFNFLFKVPNPEDKFSFTKYVDPSKNSFTVVDAQDAYSQITNNIFMDYSNEIVSNFGIKGVY